MLGTASWLVYCGVAIERLMVTHQREVTRGQEWFRRGDPGRMTDSYRRDWDEAAGLRDMTSSRDVVGRI